jgi:hypothetical protein
MDGVMDKLRPTPIPMTADRLAWIMALREAHREDAEADIEDHRDVYLALTDLLDALGVALGRGPLPR